MLDGHAYSTVVFKAISDGEQRIVEGIASTPALDRDGDILEPTGADYKLPMPFLWQHDIERPIGEVISATVTPAGIRIRAQIAKVSEPGKLKDRLDESWQSIKSGLVRGLSLKSVFKLNDSVKLPGGGRRVSKWLWLETSAVTIPANQEASISLVKSLDAAHLAVSGNGGGRPTVSPGVSGSRSKGEAMSFNASEQVVQVQNELTEKREALQSLMTKSFDENGLTSEEATERDTLSGAIESLTKNLAALKALETAVGAEARPVSKAVAAPAKKADVRVVELEKGIRMARVAMAIAAGRGSVSDTLEYAKRWNGQTPEVYQAVKQMVTKAVEGTSVVESPGWGGELVYQNNVAGELIELLRPATIVGRIQGFRPGVFNTRMAIQTGGSTVNWVGEGAVKPVTELAFDTVTLPYHKLAGIVVLTEELVRLSSPSAEATVRNDLVQQIARFIDEQFILPSVAAGANNPASITNGVASPAASGTDADALYVDINTALAAFDDNTDTSNLVIVMPPALARGISTLRNALGTMEFPSLNGRGGTLMGYQVIVSSSVPSGTIVIINPADILLADDGRVSLDASNQATLDMAGGGTPNFNLWQRNCIAIRAERWITWKAVRSAVAVIDTAAYAPS